MKSPEFSAAEVRELFTYDPETGVVAWRHKHRNKQPGTVAGSLHKNTGYWRLNVFGQKYQAHRIAWLIYHGERPAVIDHINGDKVDNRICNLRSVSPQINAQNLRKASANSKSRYLGANWHKPSGLWQAKIYVGGKYVHIGLFSTEEEAHNAYVQAKRLLHVGVTI